MVEIYAENYFIINFAADFLVTLLCARVIGYPLKYRFAALSSLIGSVYALAVIYIGIQGVLSVACNIAAAVLMCAVCFGNTSLKAFTKAVAVFYISGIVLGGGLTALSNILNYASSYIKSEIPLSVLLFASGVLCFVFTSLGNTVTGKTKGHKTNVEVYLMGKQAKLCFLCDTGNFAVDPYSGRPVIIVKAESCKALLGEKAADFDKSFPSAEIAAKLKMRYIPIKTAAGESVLKAFLAEKAYICSDGEKAEIDAYFAVDTSRKNDYCGTDGVIPFGLVSDLI